jgi:hypothetical protein
MKPIVIPILLALLLEGCGSNDERLVNMAQDHEKRQAEQSQQMARLQHEVAEGARKLVEEDAKAREALTNMQDNLRGDQAKIGQQRDALEADRREVAAQRNRDPIIAATLMQVGLYIACLLPLILAGYRRVALPVEVRDTSGCEVRVLHHSESDDVDVQRF